MKRSVGNHFKMETAKEAQAIRKDIILIQKPIAALLDKSSDFVYPPAPRNNNLRRIARLIVSV